MHKVYERRIVWFGFVHFFSNKVKESVTCSNFVSETIQVLVPCLTVSEKAGLLGHYYFDTRISVLFISCQTSFGRGI